MTESLTRLIEEYPQLLLLPGETAKVWAARARSWLSREIRPVRYSDAVSKFRFAVDNYRKLGINT